MADLEQTHVEIYVFRRDGQRVEFLCLRRAAGRQTLPGIWQPVTGKRRRAERAAVAARRELLEETGLRPRRMWILETVTTYFDPEADRIRVLPLFAAEIGRSDVVVLSREHDAFRFLGLRAAGDRYLWESQRRALAAVRREVLSRPSLARALQVQNGR